jgi:chromosome partitioning protein
MTNNATRIIAVANQKGGVGKTTTVVNLGVALAKMDKPTLVVDLDPQGALSVGLGIDGDGLEETLYTAMMDANLPVPHIVHPIKTHLDLIPANIELASAEMELIAEIRRERILSRILGSVQEEYDYILIDCPPSLGLLTINALCACQQVLIPMQVLCDARHSPTAGRNRMGQISCKPRPCTGRHSGDHVLNGDDTLP